MDAIEFFQLSAGRWRSQRATHHLAFKQAEMGDSEIDITSLAADHPDVVALCELHKIDPALAGGGSLVTWQGSMSWDREGENNHTGQTVFALVPDQDQPRRGRLLRDRGYAEVMPVVGHYWIDDEEGLVLTTEYETMSSTERFWFVGPNLRLRTSTVKRFGGFSTASFCSESRILSETDPTSADQPSVNPSTIQSHQDAVAQRSRYSLLGW